MIVAVLIAGAMAVVAFALLLNGAQSDVRQLQGRPSSSEEELQHSPEGSDRLD